MVTLLAMAHGQTYTLDVPFPTRSIFDVPDTVCLQLGNLDLGVEAIEVEDGRFRAACRSAGGRTEACLTLQLAEWPTRYAPLRCEGTGGTLIVRPVPAFDPQEDVWDGVEIVRGVSVVQATFRVDVPDMPGLMTTGTCGVTDGRLWIKAEELPRKQACTLIFDDGEERVVPVDLVRRLKARLQEEPVSTP